MENRQRIFRGVAGAYLTYLGVKLIAGFIHNEPGFKLFMVFIGAAFVILGVGLIIWVARDVGLESFGDKDTHAEIEEEEKSEEEKPEEKE